MADRSAPLPTLRPLLAVALLAGALLAPMIVPTRAAAASYTLRPAATLQRDQGWYVAPDTLTADRALAAPVTQPATPSTTGPQLTVGSGNGITTTVAVAAPALAINESATAATAWVYAATGAGQPLTVSLLSGSTTLASTHVGANKAAAWLAVAVPGPLSAGQVNQLAIALTSSGHAQDISDSAVYAAYVALTTTVAPGSGTSGVGTGVGTPGNSGGGPTGGGPGPAGAFAPSLAPPTIAVPSQPVVVPAAATSIPIALTCPAAALGGCHGMLTLTLSPGSAGHRRGVAVIARCGRGCRTIGRAPFNIARGRRAKVPVHMARRGRGLFGTRKRITVTATTTVHDGRGRPHRASAQIVLSRG